MNAKRLKVIIELNTIVKLAASKVWFVDDNNCAHVGYDVGHKPLIQGEPEVSVVVDNEGFVFEAEVIFANEKSALSAALNHANELLAEQKKTE